MKYSTFEQAAVEASSGLREIDSEIERLKAKRVLLDTLVRQLSAVLPMITEATPADDTNKAGAPAAEQPSFTDVVPDDKAYSLRTDGWPSGTANGQRGIREIL